MTEKSMMKQIPISSQGIDKQNNFIAQVVVIATVKA